MKKFLTVIPLAALLASTACTVDRLTEPDYEALAASGLRMSASVGGAGGGSLDFAPDLTFITDVSTGFADAAAAERFREQIVSLRSTLDAGDRTEAQAALDLARQELTPAVVNDGDRGYIEWIFDSIHKALAQ